MTKTGLRWSWIALVVIIIDQITKWFALQKLFFAQPFPVFPGFNLTLLYNTGAAFSFLARSNWATGLFAAFAIVMSIFILSWLKRLSLQQKWLAIALSFILGGALGNLIDRIHHGYVIDFIQVYYQQWYWPAFNVADSAITVGAMMLLLEVLFRKKQPA